MHISLVIPPSPFLIDDRAFPFLGPLQIGAVGRERGHEVSVIDLTGYQQRHADKPTPEKVLQESRKRLLVEAAGSDLIGFYSLAAQHPTVVNLHALAKEQLGCKTAIGGPHANTAPERCLEDGFDYVVAADQGGGGGEPGFLELVERVATQNKEPIIKVPSRVKGERYSNDQWPLPARDLIDLTSYHYRINGERATSIVTSAGCPFACSYCSHWDGYRKLEMKSPEKVRQELRYIKERYGWSHVMMYDDEINLRTDFYDAFLPMLKEEGVTWRAFFKNGPKLTHEAIFKACAEAGCAQLCTGAESANEQILKDIHKGATKQNNSDFVRFCVKYGIKPKVFTQVGLPGETPETVLELRDWLIEMVGEGLSDADVSITTPYEGTPLYDTPEKFNIHFDKAKLNYSKELVLYKGIPGEYTSHVWHDRLSKEELVAARQFVEDEFRKAAGLPPLVAKDDG